MRCPRCQGLILHEYDVRRCGNCGWYDIPPFVPTYTIDDARRLKRGMCQYCGEWAGMGMTECRYCKKREQAIKVHGPGLASGSGT